MTELELPPAGNGTPFDQDMPEAYIRPLAAPVPEEAAGAEAGQPPAAAKSREHRLRRAALAFSLLALPTVGMPGANDIAGRISSAMAGTDCRYAPLPDLHALSRTQILQEVEHIPFAVGPVQAAKVEYAINQAASGPAIQAILQKQVLGQFGITVALNQLPPRDLGLIPVSRSLPFVPKSTIGRPALHQEQVDSDTFVEDLSRVPRAFLREMSGLNLYLDWNIHLWGASDASGVYAPPGGLAWHEPDSIIMDMAQEGDGEVFYHELNHGLQARQCGADSVEDPGFSEFAKINPRGFTYANSTDDKKWEKRGNLTVAAGQTVSEYAAADPAEDVAETGSSLLIGEYNQAETTAGTLGAVALAKQNLIMGRQAELVPDIAAYYYYLALVGDPLYPAIAAQRDTPTTDCFGRPLASGFRWDTAGARIPGLVANQQIDIESVATAPGYPPSYHYGVELAPGANHNTVESYMANLVPELVQKLNLPTIAVGRVLPIPYTQDQVVGNTPIACLGINFSK
jgi:hypothetical protein